MSPVEFGNLYSGEVRKVLVKPCLLTAHEEGYADVLQCSYSYRLSGKKFESKPTIISVNRVKMVSAENQRAPLEVIAKETHINVLTIIRASSWSPVWDSHLMDARKYIEGSNVPELLSVELQELIKWVASHDSYRNQDALNLALLISHEAKR